MPAVEISVRFLAVTLLSVDTGEQAAGVTKTGQMGVL